MDRKLVLIELNEINFDVVSFYIERGVPLPGFRDLIGQGIVCTEAEPKYENLEPWIQWPSVHTGKIFEEHNVFRLGDFVNSCFLRDILGSWWLRLENISLQFHFCFIWLNFTLFS